MRRPSFETAGDSACTDSPVTGVARPPAAGSPHSRYPVYRESHDEVVGFVHVRDLLDPQQSGRSTPVGEVVRPVLYLPAALLY